jgi:hypothetical protein
MVTPIAGTTPDMVTPIAGTTPENNGTNGFRKYNSLASTKNGAIEAERAKCSLTYKEVVAPGLMVELELRRILAGPIQSEYQKVEILDTYFGKVSVVSGKQ